MASGKKVLKWVGITFGSLLALLILAAILIPLLVDVDKFRPQIVEIANQNINGKFELGKLKLSLWGQIKVQVDGFALSDKQGRKVVSVNDVYFHVPFTSIFSGSPRLTFRMNQPEVVVIKDKDGINALTLMKPQEKGAAPAPGTSAAKAPPSGGSALPGVVANARLGIEMIKARLAYSDKTTDLTSQVNDLNVRVKDLSLSRPTEVEISAVLDTRMGKALLVRGPASITATAQPTFQGSEFQRASVVLKVDMDNVEIQYGDLFHKKSGIPMNVDGTLAATMTSAKIESMVARFHNAEIKMHGGASGFGGTTSPVLEFKMASNSIDLSPWAQLVPMLKAYELSGAMGMDAEAHGPTDKLQYQANLEVKTLKAKAPMLKAQPEINAQVKVVTDKVERLTARMKAPGNNLSIDGTVISFTKPKVNFRVQSTEMDLDQLIDFPKPAPKAAANGKPAAPAPTQTAANGKPAPAADFDAMLDPLRENPIAADTDANISFALKFVKVMNVRMEPIEGQFTFKGLTASLNGFRMGVFDGKISSSAAFELKPKQPRYTFGMEVAGLDMKKAVTSQLEMFKNTVYGKASFAMKGRGTSFNPEPAKVNLDAAGNLSVADAQFASLDVARIAVEAINKALVGLESKIPGVKGKQVKAPPNSETGYERVTANFTIQKGVFSMPNFAAVSGKHKGIDIQGATVIGLTDYKLNADWQIIDTHDITGARGVTVDVNGVKIDPLLSEPGQPVRFPIKVAGTLFAPAPSYTSVPEALIKVAMANVGRAAEAKVKAEANARVQAEVKKLEQKAPPAVKKAIEGLGKKFKF